MDADLFTVLGVSADVLFASVSSGMPASRVSPRRATYFSLLRQRNLRKRKATRWSGSFRFAPGNLRCSSKAGSRSNSPAAQTIASPDPLLPPLLGPARRVGETNTNADAGRRGRALRVLAGVRLPTRIRSRTRSWSHYPSGCAEERRSRRIRASDCLSVASSSSTPAGPSTAGCPQRSGGSQTAGSPFLLLTFLLATQKKSELPPGNPRLVGEPNDSESPASVMEMNKC